MKEMLSPLKCFVTLLITLVVMFALMPTQADAQAGGAAPSFHIQKNGFINADDRGWTNMNTIVFTNEFALTPAEALALYVSRTNRVDMEQNVWSGVYTSSYTRADNAAVTNRVYVRAGRTTNVAVSVNGVATP